MVKRSCERFYMAKVLLTITQKCFKSSIVENLEMKNWKWKKKDLCMYITLT